MRISRPIISRRIPRLGFIYRFRVLVPWIRISADSNPRPRGILGGVAVVDFVKRRVEQGGLVAVEVVEPVADEVSLVEDAADGADEGYLGEVRLADVEDLKREGVGLVRW